MTERKQGRRSAQHAEETKQKILMAATEMFCVHGYERVSLRSISEQAGVSHSLIRHHFGSKEKIWYEISDGLHDYIQRYMAHTLDQMPDGTPANQRLYTLTIRILAFMLTYPQPIQLIADAVRQEDALFDYFISTTQSVQHIVLGLADDHNEMFPEKPVDVAEIKWLMIMFAHSAASLRPFLKETWSDEENKVSDEECLLKQWRMYEGIIHEKLSIKQENRLHTEKLADIVYHVPCYNWEGEEGCPCDGYLNSAI
ncbi:TetR/AcrR family transcriptional regulator [Vibrio sp. SCSIO 43136]|uniref:TetR/AcrR family transcriptional regulator n=1 Tax=Vibrio sp. SCSIO 43136 TaxID=2819101 RepID=UPI002074AE26|nr:TetR/AcrR family transcriptional regulator [Vibrio sp. SCSIO 43136]USD64021.1 TetR/AcrR family transcriptional regulator [Vibrio sp. SCSIO 43136]